MSSGSTPFFRVIEHTLKCQHTREYLAATRNGDLDRPRLSVKQYIPSSNVDPQPGDVTIIGAHANGFPKELYEPLWAGMVTRMAEEGVNVRSIWIADVWNQGQSGVLNEDIMGNDPSWFDHSRDLLSLINQKQEDMPHPLVGVGHSMGATQLAYLSLLHPRLLHSLVLIDPVIQRGHAGITPAVLSTPRRDIWPTRDEAVFKFKQSAFYQNWDPRVFDLWLQYALRETPTDIYPSNDGSATLTTSKHQELLSYLRPTYRTIPGETYSDRPPVFDEQADYPFYRPEPVHMFDRLPELRPGTLYILGDKSPYSTPELRGPMLASTGIGIGGNRRGADPGRVLEVSIDCGHMIPFEKVKECADAAASFLLQERRLWDENKQAFLGMQERRSRREQITVDERWAKTVRPRGLSGSSKI